MSAASVDLRRGTLALDDPAGLLAGTLAEFKAPPRPGQRPVFTLHVRDGEVPTAPPREVESSDREGLVYHFWRDTAQRHVLIAGQAALATGPQAAAVLTVAPECSALARAELAMIALEEALHVSGQALIHCAALQPAGAEGVVLVHAASGTGKTTTSLALAGAGFGLAADDAAVIGRDADDAISAWGLPRALNLHRDSARMLDWLRPALPDPWPARDEISVPQRCLPPPVRLVRETLPVLALVELRRTGTAGLAPQSPGDALSALIADNINVTASGLWPVQQGRLEALVALTGQGPCHVLGVESGSDGLQAAIRAMQSAF